jgi:hypothetical protein
MPPGQQGTIATVAKRLGCMLSSLPKAAAVRCMQWRGWVGLLWRRRGT